MNIKKKAVKSKAEESEVLLNAAIGLAQVPGVPPNKVQSAVDVIIAGTLIEILRLLEGKLVVGK